MALPAGTAFASIEDSALALALNESVWLYASVQIVHLVGVALLFGSIAVLDLRLLGLGRAIPVRRLSAHVLPWTLASFMLIVPSGLALFAADAGNLIESTLFAVKLGLIFAGGCNAAFYHAGVAGSLDRWDSGAAPPVGARIAGAASLLLWVAVIACGRLLEYV